MMEREDDQSDERIGHLGAGTVESGLSSDRQTDRTCPGLTSRGRSEHIWRGGQGLENIRLFRVTTQQPTHPAPEEELGTPDASF